MNWQLRELKNISWENDISISMEIMQAEGKGFWVLPTLSDIWYLVCGGGGGEIKFPLGSQSG